MATWRAEIKVTNTGNYFPVTVEAGASYTAKETIQHIYDPITIRNLRQVSSSSGSSGDSEISGGAVIGLVGLIAAGWAILNITPWIMMLFLGAFSTWCGQVITGQTIEEYNEREDGKGNKRVIFVLILALISGGFGFVKGTELQKQWNTPEVPAQVQKK